MFKRILVVDEEPEIQQLLHAILKSEYSVVMASNGCQALEQLVSAQPDLVILDLLMPEMDGYETLQHIRENAATAQLPVIILSACDLDSAVATAWRRGVDLYLTKPFQPADLLICIERLLQEA